MTVKVIGLAFTILMLVELVALLWALAPIIGDNDLLKWGLVALSVSTNLMLFRFVCQKTVRSQSSI